MGAHLTTRCCSALALTLAIACAPAPTATRSFPAPRSTDSNRSKADAAPLPLFPVAPIWTLALNNTLAAPPVFDRDRAFFAIEGNRIVAYDLARGTQSWIVQAATAIQPAASPELLFVVEPRQLAALRVTDGSPAWTLPFADAPAAPPTWDNGWLIVATLDGAVHALRAADGKRIWRQTIGSPAHAPPALAADRVYIAAEDGRIVALRVDTGALLWERRLGGTPSEILALDDRVYVGSKDNFLYSLKTDTGERDWRWGAGADVIGLPAIDERTVYCVSLANVLWALNRNTGNLRWKRALPLRPTSGPIEAGQTLLVSGVSQAPKLPAFTAKDGTPAGDITAGGEIAAPMQSTTLSGVYGPVVMLITQDIVKGATVTAYARSLEPPIAPVSPLSGLETLTPAAPPPPK